jgi:hypothetical protein
VVNRPSVPEVITVNSEALQTRVRDLLPSQNGFGSELQASNVITPIIDLTAAAEGSTVPFFQQQALAFGNITSFEITGTTTALAASAGFWRFYGVSNVRAGNATIGNLFTITDGASTKQIWAHKFPATATVEALTAVNYDFTVFLTAGDSVSGRNIAGAGFLTGSYYQVAEGDGTLVNPVGFPV